MTTELQARPVRRRGGAGWLLIATTAAGVANYGYALAMTHGLSPAQYAIFAAGQALLMVRATISSAAISWVLAREVSIAGEDDRRRVVVVSFAFWSNLALGAVLTAVVAIGVLTFGSAADALVLTAASVILSFGSTGVGYLQGIGRIGAIARLLTVEAVVKALAGAVFVFAAGWQSAGALAGFAVGSLVLLLPVLGLRHMVRRPAWGGAEAELLRAALRQTRLQASVAVLSATDVIMAAVLGSGTAAGPYQAASALGRVPLFASNAVSTAAFAQLSADGSATRKAAALRSYLLVSALMAIALVTLPTPVQQLLLPDSFAAVGRWLGWAAVLGVMVGLFNLAVTFLQAGDARGSTAITVAGLAVAFVAVVAVSGAARGVSGVAVGAAIASVPAVALLLLMPSIRPGLRHLATTRDVAYDIGLLGGIAAALVLVRHPAAWLGVAALAGAVVLLRAFPDLAPRRRR
ncbi:hypothetical protein [Dactylosporangium sp. CA-092794]|uniref:hypothetical protein n=1 Tax=Dactylosporangium sp. CA-092794 TaxID=3239929 RepID=UPI003D93ACD1